MTRRPVHLDTLTDRPGHRYTGLAADGYPWVQGGYRMVGRWGYMVGRVLYRPGTVPSLSLYLAWLSLSLALALVLA